MKRLKDRQSDASSLQPEATLAKTLAPEDIRPKDFVTVLQVVHEFPSFLWFDKTLSVSVDEPVRIRFTSDDGGVPLRVCAVCLPFVLVERSNGARETIDVRRQQLARLDNSYARIVWKSDKRKKAKRKRK